VVATFFDFSAVKVPPRMIIKDSYGLLLVIADITEPCGSSNESKIIIHCADNSKKWPKKGLFAAISEKWPEPEKTFTETDASLGDVQVVKVQAPETETGKLYVCTVIGQKAVSGGIPVFNPKAFLHGVTAILNLARSKNASLHLPKIASSIPGVDWPTIENQLGDLAKNSGLSIYIYTKPPASDRKNNNIPEKSTKFQKPVVLSAPPKLGAPKEKPKEEKPTSVFEKSVKNQPAVSDPPPKIVAPKEKPKEEKPNLIPKRELVEKRPAARKRQKTEVFKQVRIVFADMVDQQRLSQLVNDMSGTFVDKWSKEATHLIASKFSPVVEQAARAAHFIVTPNWIVDCYDEQRVISEELYCCEIPGNILAPMKVKPLPNLFTGMAIYIHVDVDRALELRRYIVAFNGDISEYVADATTHVVLSPDAMNGEEYLEMNSGVTLVNPFWIWDSINTRKLRDTSAYTIN